MKINGSKNFYSVSAKDKQNQQSFGIKQVFLDPKGMELLEQLYSGELNRICGRKALSKLIPNTKSATDQDFAVSITAKGDKLIIESVEDKVAYVAADSSWQEPSLFAALDFLTTRVSRARDKIFHSLRPKRQSYQGLIKLDKVPNAGEKPVGITIRDNNGRKIKYEIYGVVA